MPDQQTPRDALARMASLLSEAVSRVVPNVAGTDWQNRLTPALEGALQRLELVPREEFERQVAEIARLEGELAKLEARISALEGH